LWEQTFSPSGDVEAGVDLDGDLYSNLVEFLLQSNPTEFDLSLSDELIWTAVPDAWKLQIVDADSNDSISSLSDVRDVDDFDGDGLSNLEEFIYGTSPILYSTDGDDLSDAHEMLTRVRARAPQGTLKLTIF